MAFVTVKLHGGLDSVDVGAALLDAATKVLDKDASLDEDQDVFLFAGLSALSRRHVGTLYIRTED
jgi:hypothetical protein